MLFHSVIIHNFRNNNKTQNKTEKYKQQKRMRKNCIEGHIPDNDLLCDAMG